jgi:hypothetical protein
MFTTFLFEKLSHLNSFYNNETEFIQHLMSGEVTVTIPDLIKFQQEYEKQKPLPSLHQITDKVWLRLWSADISSEVLNVHFYPGKVKYDLTVFGENGETTRLYNIDPLYVVKKIVK